MAGDYTRFSKTRARASTRGSPYKPRDVAKQQEDNDNAAPVKVKEAVKLPLPNEFVTHFVGKCIAVFLFQSR